MRYLGSQIALWQKCIFFVVALLIVISVPLPTNAQVTDPVLFNGDTNFTLDNAAVIPGYTDSVNPYGGYFYPTNVGTRLGRTLNPDRYIDSLTVSGPAQQESATELFSRALNGAVQQGYDHLQRRVNETARDPAGEAARMAINAVVQKLETLSSDWMNAAANLVLGIVNIFVLAAGAVLNLTIYLTIEVANELLNHRSVGDAWRVFRDITNIGMIFIVLYIAIQTILGTSSTPTKKMLGGIIIAALLINFSLFITKFMVDISNRLTLEFYSAIINDPQGAQGLGQAGDSFSSGDIAGGISNTLNVATNILDRGLSNVIYDQVKLQTIYETSAHGANQAGAAAGNLLFAGHQNIIGIILGTVVLVTTAIIILMISILLIIRFAMIYILLATSAIGFTGLILQQKWLSKWWTSLWSNLIFPPAMFILLWLGLFLVSQMPIVSTDAAATGNWAQLFSVGFSTALTNSLFLLPLKYVIMMVFLIASVTIAKSLGASGAATIIKTGKALSGTLTGWAGRNTLGRLGSVWGTQFGDFTSRMRSALQEGPGGEAYQQLGGWGRMLVDGYSNLAPDSAGRRFAGAAGRAVQERITDVIRAAEYGKYGGKFDYYEKIKDYQKRVSDEDSAYKQLEAIRRRDAADPQYRAALEIAERLETDYRRDLINAQADRDARFAAARADPNWDSLSRRAQRDIMRDIINDTVRPVRRHYKEAQIKLWDTVRAKLEPGDVGETFQYADFADAQAGNFTLDPDGNHIAITNDGTLGDAIWYYDEQLDNRDVIDYIVRQGNQDLIHDRTFMELVRPDTAQALASNDGFSTADQLQIAEFYRLLMNRALDRNDLARLAVINRNELVALDRRNLENIILNAAINAEAGIEDSRIARPEVLDYYAKDKALTAGRQRNLMMNLQRLGAALAADGYLSEDDYESLTDAGELVEAARTFKTMAKLLRTERRLSGVNDLIPYENIEALEQRIEENEELYTNDNFDAHDRDTERAGGNYQRDFTNGYSNV